MRGEGEVTSYQVDQLSVRVFESREAAGRAAGAAVAGDMHELAPSGPPTATTAAQADDSASGLATNPAREGAGPGGQVGMVFASAPSQLELLAALLAQPDLPWPQVTAFHLDEYVGIEPQAPQSFARFLREHLFVGLPIGEVHYLDGQAEPERECERYGQLLRSQPLSVACIGIGENGHIAFNEPEDTDFDDDRLVRVVQLDERSRRQQVNEGLFPRLEAVPKKAITLTVPAIVAARRIHCIVPGRNKADAVKSTLEEEVGPHCPATALRRHAGATLYLDQESSSLLGGIEL